MIFVTVGSLLPFDRLVAAVDELAVRAKLDEVFAQIGDTRFRPKNIRSVPTLSRGDFDRMLADARYVISHAGVGAITSALSLGKPIIVMPRRKAFGEHVNDHQVSTAERFGAAGHVLVAQDARELEACIAQVGSFVPKPRSAQPRAVAERIAAFLNTL